MVADVYHSIRMVFEPCCSVKCTQYYGYEVVFGEDYLIERTATVEGSSSDVFQTVVKDNALYSRTAEE